MLEMPGKKAAEIFEIALDCEPAELQELLDRECGDDEALRARVKALLAADARASGLLDSPPFGTTSLDAQADPAAELIGRRIGRFHVLRIIASGGMGTVYEASQQEPYRTVALKVMKAGIASRSALRRFSYESQLLARLRHPAIAQVYEAGVHEEGSVAVPFFAMEYIANARSINVYAEEQGLGTHQRLELFGQVCDAVQHGHQKGIIHRDLKPGNLLVDEMGYVKVIDFGVARSTDADVSATTMQTDVGQLIGTLQYMSPEQCTADPHDIDMRSDIYSLGMVLYELLSRELPYDVSRLALPEATRVIREKEPKKPSSINRTLRGDLETIVLKSLEKDRAGRYQTVSSFAGDIRSYLRGGAILARPTGPVARAWKRIKRNPATSAAGGMALFSLMALLLYVLWSYPQILSERNAVLRLSDAQRLSALLAEEEELWPAVPERVANLEGWLARARTLAGRLETHRRTLEELRSRADGPGGRTWIFARAEDQWQHDTLAELVQRLEAFADERGGTIDRVETRLAFARTVLRESIEKYRDEWDMARVSINDPEQCPLYQGLAVEPVLGLVPIGRDPNSGLWEFAHLQSGDVPERGPDGNLLLDEDSGLVFVLIPGGGFEMGAVRPGPGMPVGSPTVDPCAQQDEGPVHPVDLEPFFLSKYEMTQAQWERCTGSNPSIYGPGRRAGGTLYSALHPVENVNWRDCRRVLRHQRLRFPSEAEWEYAARAGTTTVWWTGNGKRTLAGAANILDRHFKEYGNYPFWECEEWLDDGYTAHAPVGRFLPNGFGLHDILGNVSEWCGDSHHDGYENAPADGRAWLAADSPYRIIRGGGCYSTVLGCRSSCRYGEPLDNRNEYCGIRPVLSLP